MYCDSRIRRVHLSVRPTQTYGATRAQREYAATAPPDKEKHNKMHRTFRAASILEPFPSASPMEQQETAGRLPPKTRNSQPAALLLDAEMSLVEPPSFLAYSSEHVPPHVATTEERPRGRSRRTFRGASKTSSRRSSCRLSSSSWADPSKSLLKVSLVSFPWSPWSSSHRRTGGWQDERRPSEPSWAREWEWSGRQGDSTTKRSWAEQASQGDWREQVRAREAAS
jgi:hypothetical protein